MREIKNSRTDGGERVGSVLWRGLSVLPHESFNPALRVHELLFAGKERMTTGADLCIDLFPCRPCLEFIPARTPYNGFHVFRVDSFLHRVHSLYRSGETERNARRISPCTNHNLSILAKNEILCNRTARFSRNISRLEGYSSNRNRSWHSGNLGWCAFSEPCPAGTPSPRSGSGAEAPFSRSRSGSGHSSR